MPATTTYHISQQGTLRHAHGGKGIAQADAWHNADEPHRTDPQAHYTHDSWNPYTVHWTRATATTPTAQKTSLIMAAKASHDTQARNLPLPTVAEVEQEEDDRMAAGQAAHDLRNGTTPTTLTGLTNPTPATPRVIRDDKTEAQIKSLSERVENVEEVILNVGEAGLTAQASVKQLTTKVDANAQVVVDVTNALKRRIVELEAAQATNVVITINDVAARTQVKLEGIHHFKFATLVAITNALDPADRNIWLTGPAGTGKTTAARQLAEVMQLDHEFNSSIGMPHELVGYRDAGGHYNDTQYRRMYGKGGVMLLDECDGSSANALLALNASLSGPASAFPDGMVKRHSNFICLASANTWGFGSDADYVGRAKLDAAFMDRFVTLTWPTDEYLERIIAGGTPRDSDRQTTPTLYTATNVTPPIDDWVTVVQEVRAAAKQKKAQFVISPRASVKGAQLLKAHIHPKIVVECIFGRYASHNLWGEVGRAAETFANRSVTLANVPTERTTPVLITSTPRNTNLPTPINSVDFSGAKVF